MPIFRNHNVLELVRGIKAFLHLDAGVTRGPVPDPRRLEAQVRKQTLELREVRQQAQRQTQQLKQARQRLTNKDRKLTKTNRELSRVQSRLKGSKSGGSVESQQTQQQVVESFHKLYYDSSKSGGTWQDTFWMGVPVWKCPLDLWIYQEILFEQRPDVIIETGTAFGGSALFMSSVCDLLDNGEIITVDIKDREGRPRHERVQYITGSSTDEEIVAQIKERTEGAENVLVILDSDHRKPHVDDELNVYSQLVREGNYLIVEDSNVNGHPVRLDFGPGPMEALEEFLEKNESFAIDGDKEKFFMTFNPRGFLRKTGRS